MALLCVRVTQLNGLDESMAYQGEIAADAVRRPDVDAVIDTRYFYRLITEAGVEQLGLPACGKARSTLVASGARPTRGVPASVMSCSAGGARWMRFIMGDRVHLDGTMLGQTDLRDDEASGLIVPNLATWEQPLLRI